MIRTLQDAHLRASELHALAPVVGFQAAAAGQLGEGQWDDALAQKRINAHPTLTRGEQEAVRRGGNAVGRG